MAGNHLPHAVTVGQPVLRCNVQMSVTRNHKIKTRTFLMSANKNRMPSSVAVNFNWNMQST